MDSEGFVVWRKGSKKLLERITPIVMEAGRRVKSLVNRVIDLEAEKLEDERVSESLGIGVRR